ncbi:MAG: ATP-dependent DNA helicase [Deltaproteobacteria bacterium]
MTYKKKQPRFSPPVVQEDFPPGLEKNPDFMKVFDFLENTREHVFVTGEAGTGKSTLLRYFRSRSAKNLAVVAPTGVAAINVGGQTIHSFFRFPFHFMHRSDIKKLHKPEVMLNLDTLIIDEASMIRADMMDAIDYSLRLNRGNMKTAFGGVQVVFFGDLFQLPPVMDEGMELVYKDKYENPYFFQAEVFDYIKPKYIALDKIYRQSNEDFIRLLQRVRNGECGEGDMEILNDRVKPLDFDRSEHIVTLTAVNADASRMNERRLAALPGKEYRFNARIQGEFDPRLVIADEVLRLKKGAQIMMLRNDPEKRWVNGTIGRVAELDENTIQVEIGGEVFEVAMSAWEKLKYSYDEVQDTIEREVIGLFQQFPLKLAWAITIHKSQGQTFDELHIDLGRGAFAHGQLYVALSRCRTLEGVTLKRPVLPSDFIFDERIFGFRQRFERLELN